MAHSDSPATPGAPRAAAGGGVRMVRVPDHRAGQRLDNFLLGQVKGAPKALVYKIVRSGQVRVNGGRAEADTRAERSEEHPSELQPLMRTSYAVLCLQQKK